jgi:hypothetical protein
MGPRYRSRTPYVDLEQMYLDQRLRFYFLEGSILYIRAGTGIWLNTQEKIRAGDTWLIPASMVGAMKASPNRALHMWLVTLPLQNPVPLPPIEESLKGGAAGLR